MSKKRIVQYSVWSEDNPSFYIDHHGNSCWSNWHKRPTKKSAFRLARKFGKNTIIQLFSKTLAGKRKIKEWIIL